MHAATLALVAVAVAVALAAGTRSYDDAYITYAYARSVSAGEGLTWHGRPVLGTSSPFLAVALGGLERAIPLGIPIWGALLSALAGLGGALALAGLGRREGWAWGGIAAGLFWLLWPGRYGHGGGEMAMAIGAVAGAAWAFAAERPKTAGALLALAACLRAEAGLAALVLAGALVARDGLRRAVPAIARAALVAAPLVALWAAALWRLAGTLLPRTLEAKRAQAASELGVWSAAGWRLLADEGAWLAGAATSVLGVLFALSALGLFVAARRRHALGGALGIWGIGHLVLLAALGVPKYTWYVEPFRFGLLVAAGLGVGAASLLEGRSARRARLTVAALVLVLVGYGVAELVGFAGSPGDTRREIYLRVAEAADDYPSGTTLAAYEVGYLGFASRQPVLDLLGLVTPEAPLDAVRRGDLAAVRRRLDPDLVALPLSGGSLVGSTIGDPAEFLATYALDRLLLGGEPNVALFRRASLPGRGPVARDLLHELAADGGRVEYRAQGAESGLALRLGAEERRTLPLGAGSRGRLVLALGSEAVEAELAVELEVAGEPGRLAAFELEPGAPWRLEALPLEPDDLPRTLAFRCAAEPGASCLVGLPYLASR